MVEKVTGSIFTRYEKSARSQQGMAIWRDEAFLYYHGGSCDVMDLKEKKDSRSLFTGVLHRRGFRRSLY